MADVLTPEQRKLNMSRIRDKNTKPELILRKGLHSLGLRFRLHRNDLPGKPDIVIPKHRVVILVHGCFWHGHNCHLFKQPTTRSDFWRSKISANRERDKTIVQQLNIDKWRVLSVWECSLRGKKRLSMDSVLSMCVDFINGDAVQGEIVGSSGTSLTEKH
ncbi:MAG: DNA mismatch endonuclease Vsr [Desulfovibrionaceae bacterium]|nr:DNA mismatch endonuclease Vsr [Desulfovibrionaceae bacterium]